MAVLEIVTVPHPVLRRKAQPVKPEEFGPELERLAQDMIETMRAAPGVGLAAPQVNVSKRLIVVEYEDEEEGIPHQLYAVVNPRIVRVSPRRVVGLEGCLSIPGYWGEVERAYAITVVGQTPRGEPLRLDLEGWLARIFQHEIDHLNGILFTDRARRVWRAEEEPDAPAV
ncbi:MAG: peptide deformylase [Chloroflexi bacterium]|nr:peptide deformylase [Chloroflexota bacterium]